MIYKEDRILISYHFLLYTITLYNMKMLVYFLIYTIIGQGILGMPRELYEGSPCRNSNYNGVWTLQQNCPAATKSVKLYGYHNFYRCGWSGATVIVCCPQVKRKSVKACEKYKNIPSLSSRIPRSPLQLYILGGEDAYKAEYPHMAALGFWNPGTKRYQFSCGGSLISENYLITAAHCIANIDRYELEIVRMGTTNVPPDTDKIDPATDYKVKKIIVHPGYNRRAQLNDIALVQLERKVLFKINRRPACLHSSNEEPINYEVSGWGTLKYDGEQSEFLQKAYQTFVPRGQCTKKYSPFGRTIGETQICAHSDTSDTCPGDSGGPLQVREPDGFTIVGITSYGAGCGGSIPGIYTRVYSYLDWIETIVWPN